jgi:DNA-binding response OmpR family regulator
MRPVESQPVVIGLTGQATEATRVVAMAAGMDECLFKPVALETIRRELRRSLAQ